MCSYNIKIGGGTAAEEGAWLKGRLAQNFPMDKEGEGGGGAGRGWGGGKVRRTTSYSCLRGGGGDIRH